MTTFQDNYLDKIVDTSATETSIGGGLLTLVNDVIVELHEGGIPHRRNIRPSTDFCMTGYRVQPNYTDFYVDTDGLNNIFINDLGDINYELLKENFQKSDLGRMLKRNSMDVKELCVCYDDAQEAFLYNMLVSVVKALVAKDSGNTVEIETADGTRAYKFEPTHVSYDSDHVTVGSEQVHKVKFDSYLGKPNPDLDLIETRQVDIADAAMFQRARHFVKFPKSSPEQVSFYIEHLAGRNTRSPSYFSSKLLNFEIDIEPVSGLVAVMPSCASDSDPYYRIERDAVDYRDVDSMYRWVLEYVRMNRLEKAYSAALEILLGLAFKPVSSSAEGTAWDASILEVTLPRMKFGRAKYDILLGGDPNKARSYKSVMTCDSVAYLRRNLVRAAVVNYATWMGVYAIVSDASDEGGSYWREALSPAAYPPGIFDGYGLRAKMLSLVTSVNTVTYEHPSAHLNIDFSPLREIEDVPGVTFKADYHRVCFDKMYAPVSGSLLMGAINEISFRYLHLLSHQKVTIPAGNNGRWDAITTLRLAQIYRLFGWDLTLLDMCGNSVKPWAPSREWVIEPASLIDRSKRILEFDPDELIARPQSADLNMLPLTRFYVGAHFELIIQRPVIRAAAFGTRATSARSVRLGYKPPKISFKVAAAYKGETIDHQAQEYQPVKYQPVFRGGLGTEGPTPGLDMRSLGMSVTRKLVEHDQLGQSTSDRKSSSDPVKVRELSAATDSGPDATSVPQQPKPSDITQTTGDPSEPTKMERWWARNLNTGDSSTQADQPSDSFANTSTEFHPRP